MLDLTADREALQRVCDRLRSLPESRLTRAVVEPGGSIADAVHELCRWAAAAQGIGDPVPRLHPLASADQLAVVGRDLLDWLDTGQGDPAALEAWRLRLQQLRTAI